jgi:hypothetical protein
VCARGTRGVPGVKVDFAEHAVAAALLVRGSGVDPYGAAEIERIGQAVHYRFEFSPGDNRSITIVLLGGYAPEGRGADVGEGPVGGVVEGCEARGEETADVVERCGRVEVGAVGAVDGCG